MSGLSYPSVVAIGASAGGLAAFQELIEHLPADTGLVYVLLSHILRGSKSLLPEILARSTRMPVVQVAEPSQKILADHIYILPPDRFMEKRTTIAFHCFLSTRNTLFLDRRENATWLALWAGFLFIRGREEIPQFGGIRATSVQLMRGRVWLIFCKCFV